MKGKFFKSNLKYRAKYIKLLFKNKFKKTDICFFPEYPHKRTIMYKLCVMLGLNIKTKLSMKNDIIVNWENKTFRKNYEELNEVSQQHPVLNINCKDISKNHVDEVFQQVFGYSLRVDPIKHKGECVQKNDLNAQKDGEIISCPVNKKNNDYVYLKLLDNTIDREHVQDIRVPVYKDTIPLIYLRTKKVENRFNNTNQKIELDDPKSIFTDKERDKT